MEQKTEKSARIGKGPVPTFVPWRTYLTKSLRIKFFATGVLFPAICLSAILLGMNPAMEQPWQSGDLSSQLTVLLSSPSILFFYPLIVYSLGCLSIWCLAPIQYSKKSWVQLGLQTGTWLSFAFMILIMPMTGIASQIMAVIVIPCLAFLTYLAKLAIRKQFSIRYLLLVTTVVALVAGVLSNNRNLRETVVMVLVASCLLIIGAAPSTGFITFLRTTVAAFQIQKDNQQIDGTVRHTPLAEKRKFAFGLVGGWLIWCGLLFASFRYAIEQQAIEYAKLPVANPNCFVSSAAAYGHPRIVGASSSLPGTGKVNLQMRRLKLLEFALSALMPRTHRAVRNVYNRIGPVMATACRANVWFADLTFLLLKPVEWTSMFMQGVLQIPQSVVAKIYRR